MTGPWPHPKTGILYYRKATPPDVFAERKRLAEFGIKVTREIQRSLGTKDRKPAERIYKQISEEVEAEWDRCRSVLREGPVVLTPKQEWAIAGDHAKVFLAKHEDDPFAAPKVAPLPDAGDDDRGAMAKALAKMGATERRAFTRDLRAYLSTRTGSRTKLAFSMLETYPALRQVLGPDLAALLEKAHGKDTDAALAAHGLSVAPETRRVINLRMLNLMGAASRGLEARKGGDYSPVAALERVPPFTATPKTKTSGLSLEYLLEHKASSQSIKAKTIEDTRGHLRKFIQFVGHDDARRVTKDDVRRWRDLLIARGDLAPKTVSDRYLSALRSVLSHGLKEFDLPLNVASGIKDNRSSAPPTGSKGYTEEQAVEILKATFRGSTKDLSEPHRRALFWVPWILAYTGLRVSEVTQFRGRNLKEEDGIPYLLITPEDGSTKSGKAWTAGIHKHLIGMGLLDFIRSQGDGPLFYHAYPEGTDLTALDGKHRAKDAGVRVSRWITDELGIVAPYGRANHAWRHLFTTRCRGCGMDKETRDYMMGSRSGTDAREGYGDWPPSVIDDAINKLPRFPVVDQTQVMP
jgi:integrase